MIGSIRKNILVLVFSLIVSSFVEAKKESSINESSISEKILQRVLAPNRPVEVASGLTGEHVPAGPPAILTLLLPAAPPLVGHLQGHLQGHVLLVIIG